MIQSTTYNNNVLGKAEQEFDIYQQYRVTGNSDLGKDDFLKLLVTQLKYQDPLNPMEDKEFTAQMASFSSLEQLTNISEGIDTLSEGTQRQEMLNAVAFIDKEVLAAGDTVSKIGNYVSTLSFSIDEAAGDCYVNIFDQNNNIVETVELGALSAGDYSVTWDGKDYNGQAVSDGIYSVAMAAESTSGEPILINTQVSGKVRGVRVEGSEYMLTLEDGREVSLLQIERVITPNNNDAENQDEEES
jgi:flagellar basal-body rod modification protein FlgD